MTAQNTLSVDPAFVGLRELVCAQLGFDFKQATRADISFQLESDFPEESYSLRVTPAEVKVVAGDYAGAFYGLQTLRQLFDADNLRGAYLTAPCVEIERDKPRYSWRGLQLDESRHFFGKEYVKKLLDYMAMYKLNTFHWHLTDDQGWRIEIKKYPLLTEIGSVRPGTQKNHWGSQEVDMTPYGGFYTQEDIKEIVAYAQRLNITVVPEVDFPAHSAAVLAAYSQLACRDLKRDVPHFFGGIIPEKMGVEDWNRPLCLGRDEVYSFVYDVIGEVADLFPAPYFHIGGDEAPTGEWESCKECQRLMTVLGLKNERELQAHFTNSLKDFLETKGKKTIGWNEILEGENISRDVIAQYWTPSTDKRVIEHLEQGGKAILSKHQCFYFDMPYRQVTVKNTYCFEYGDLGIDSKLLQNVMGVEAELWSEWIDSFDHLQFSLFPRIAALSETAWSDPQVKCFGGFLSRLNHHEQVYSRMGINFAEDRIAFGHNYLWKRYSAKGIDFKSYSAEYEINQKLK